VCIALRDRPALGLARKAPASLCDDARGLSLCLTQSLLVLGRNHLEDGEFVACVVAAVAVVGRVWNAVLEDGEPSRIGYPTMRGESRSESTTKESTTLPNWRDAPRTDR